jgi:hypothetical protein
MVYSKKPEEASNQREKKAFGVKIEPTAELKNHQGRQGFPNTSSDDPLWDYRFATSFDGQGFLVFPA